MKKGGIFLILSFALLVIAVVFIAYYKVSAPTGQAVYFEPAMECNLDRECVSAAISDNCRAALFKIQSPLNNSCYFGGRIVGKAVGKCEVLLEDPNTGDEMTCYVTGQLPENLLSFPALKSSCSGALLDDISPLL